MSKKGPQTDSLHVLQFSKIKGVTQGSLDKCEWSNNKFIYEDQVGEQLNQNNHYMAAVVDPSTGNIIEWKQVNMMQVKSRLKGQDGTGDTTQQNWSVHYKKKLAQEFGTSKSKRKINQMLSNTIDT